MASFAMALGGSYFLNGLQRRFVSVDLLLSLECVAAGDETGRGWF